MFFNKKWCLTLAVFCCGIIDVQGQSGGGNNEYIAQLPKVMHPSPEAMAFMRYGEIPVSLSTGVPEISIPIYTIKANGLEIPISISYHASGIKVRDISGVVGLGWVLNAGGMIAQTVYGWDDLTTDPIHKPRHDLNNLSFNSAAQALQQLMNDYNTYMTHDPIHGIVGQINRKWDGCKSGHELFYGTVPVDTETYNTVSDRFYFTFNGRSGVFRFNLQTKQYETIPYSSLKIALTTGGFRITDENGLVWEFEKQTKTENMSIYAIPTMAKEYYLTAIRFPGIDDPVSFHYSSGTTYDVINWTESVFSGTIPMFDYYGSGPLTFVEGFSENRHINHRKYSSQTSRSTPLHLDSIRWRDIRLLFEYEGNQPDLMKERLTTIRVKWADKEVRTAQLFSQNNNNRVMLSEIKINDESYSFEYMSPQQYPTGTAQPHNYSEDFWGYYNHAQGNRMVPFIWESTNISPFYTKVYNNSREANPLYSRVGILTSVTYPTKGKTVFEYEQNRGYNVFQNMKVNQPEVDYFGGLRVRKITNYDNSGRSSWKTYEYEGGPTITITPDHFCAIRQCYYLPLFPETGQPLSYRAIIYDAETGANGTGYPFTEHGANPVFYHKVTEYFGHSTVNEGKIEYLFIRDTDYSNICYQGPNPLMSPYLNNCDKGMIAPLLVSKREYANNQGTYLLRKETKNFYSKRNKGSFITGVDVKHEYEFNPALNRFFSIGNIRDFFANYYLKFHFFNIYGIRDVMLLDSTITTEYSRNNQIRQTMITKTAYQYENNLLVQTPVETAIFTNTDIIIEKVKHPFHYTTMPYTAMTNSNIYAPVIAKEKYVNGTLVATIRNDYRMDGNKFVKDSISVAKGSEPLESRIKYHNYDGYANPLYISKDNRQHVSYLWGYKGVYPVAEIRNATYNQVKTGLSGTLPESLSAAATPNMTLIDNLRNHSGLDASLVNTAQFSPLEGISAAFDANKIKTSYDYDRGILTTVKNNENQILQKYDYQFATTATVFQPAEMSLSAKILGAPFLRHKNTSALTLTVAVFDGSDNYSYSWYLKDGVYRVMNSLLNSSSNQYIVPPLTPFIGVVQVICKVTDNNTGEETEASVVFYVDIKYFEAQILGPKPCNDLFWCPDRNPNPIIDP